ncbi:concanavalin A-like lectin/glucanase [Coprinopsis marcescibilis]|uniref:Concanavalin A-like lectin/glucanase n=1 Tax=Coprinopsis marcescibilis TaxID=230819 RepID=A0A5C3KQL8_COPMA|nr:concanavalin A-like lectin/glucanase [Coprinopsis marcescibilis]
MSDKLVPPQRPFAGEGAVGNSNGDHELSNLGPSTSSSQQHSRSGSATNTDSPPVTPRSLTFQIGNANGSTSGGGPFSPPASVTSFTPAHTPSGSLIVPQNNYFEQGHRNNNSGSTSINDLPRNNSSLYGSRPTTAGDSSAVGVNPWSSRPSSTRIREAFSSPRTRPLTMYSAVQPSTVKLKREMPKSTMLDKDKPIEKPWLEKKDPHNRIAYILTYAILTIGVCLGGLRCFLSWNDVPVMKGNLCMVMDENFESAEGMFGDNGKFFREVDMSGFGNGEFEMSTDSDENSYIRDGKLYITPTFTSDLIGEDSVMDGHVFNITGCTYNITQGHSYTSENDQALDVSQLGQDREFDVEGYLKACSAVSNVTAGTVINPVRSARLTTRLSASIRYGRIDVRAKIPTGDWLWPAIWMLPVDNAYGGWPMSGEIDIMEARGNGPRYPYQGSNFVRGSLNWGPTPSLNAAWKTYGWWWMRRGSFDKEYHTYSLEWDEEFIRIFVDSRLHRMLDLRAKKSFWDLGEFPRVAHNGGDMVVLNNIWANGTKTAPFDQKFYLILDVGVGGTNGWFPDHPDKPWYDRSPTAMLEFWRARELWMPTWQDTEKRSMIIDSVKMYEKC